MGPPGRGACHGAAGSREKASFLILWSSSSFANLLIFMVVNLQEIVKMMICLFFIHHPGVFSDAKNSDDNK
jgi:hypothetical protein